MYKKELSASLYLLVAAVNVKLVIYQSNLAWNPSHFIKVSKEAWLHELSSPCDRDILGQ